MCTDLKLLLFVFDVYGRGQGKRLAGKFPSPRRFKERELQPINGGGGGGDKDISGKHF